MTDKELFRLNDLQATIRGLEKLISEIENDHWVKFQTPSREIPVPITLRVSLKEWAERQLAEAKKEFEEA